MIKQYYADLEETCHSTQLANGLTVKVIPKPGFSQKLAYFATNFGSIHRDFRLEGQEYHTPAGVAHFLEHKLFDLPDRDVTAEFAALGAHVNAFTSYDMTTYYFSCTQNFHSCLRLLLEFVSMPYFTRESVEKEYGIIDQEIAMNEDSPDSRSFEQLMQNMYQYHGVRYPILGTHDSLRQITPELLYTCHRGFYVPENMVLTVVGDVSPREVADIATDVLGRERKPAAVKLRPRQENPHCQSVSQLQMDVSAPNFTIGFKCDPIPSGSGALQADVIGYLAAEMLIGETAPLYLQLYENGVIDGSFGASFETIDGCAMLTCGGDGTAENAETVREALLKNARDLAVNGPDSNAFARLKRGVIGRRIRDLDNFDAICFRQCAYHFLGFDYFDFPRVYADVTAEQIRQFLEKMITNKRCATVITNPLSAHGEGEI